MEKTCYMCHRPLSENNQSNICLVCADKITKLNLPEILNVEQVSELLCLDEETVRWQHRAGKLPPCIPNQKRLLWLREDIIAFIKSRVINSSQAEEHQAMLAALKMGIPIDQLTGYGGGNPDALVKWYRQTLKDGLIIQNPKKK